MTLAARATSRRRAESEPDEQQRRRRTRRAPRRRGAVRRRPTRCGGSESPAGRRRTGRARQDDIEELAQGGEGRRVPRARAAHSSRLRELPQARRARGCARAGARRRGAREGAAARARQPRPCAQGGAGRRPAARGREARAHGPARPPCARRRRAVLAEGEPFDPQLHEAVAAAARAPSRDALSRSSSRATGSATTSSGRRACVVAA